MAHRRPRSGRSERGGEVNKESTMFWLTFWALILGMFSALQGFA